MNGNLRFYYKARGMFVSNSAILAKAPVKLVYFTHNLKSSCRRASNCFLEFGVGCLEAHKISLNSCVCRHQ